MVTVYKRFIWWAKNRTWEYLFEVLSKDTKLKTHGDDRFMLRKSSYVYNRSNRLYKKGPNSKIHLVINAQERVIKIIVTNGTKTSCKVAFALIKDIKTDILVTERSYNTNDTVKYAKNNDIKIIIPPKPNRKLEKFWQLFRFLYIFVTTLLKTLFLLLNIGVASLRVTLKFLWIRLHYLTKIKKMVKTLTKKNLWKIKIRDFCFIKN